MYKYMLNDQLRKLTFNTRMSLRTNKETICRWGISRGNPNAPRIATRLPAALIMSPIVKSLPYDIAQGFTLFGIRAGIKMSTSLRLARRSCQPICRVEYCVANSYWAVLIYARVFYGSDTQGQSGYI